VTFFKKFIAFEETGDANDMIRLILDFRFWILDYKTPRLIISFPQKCVNAPIARAFEQKTKRNEKIQKC